MRLAVFVIAVSAWAGELETARDRQDRAALEKLATQQSSEYRGAIAYSYLAEVCEQLHDRGGVKGAAESGIRLAERAVALKPDVAEHYRVLGTLYGQIVPVNVLTGLSYGKKAQQAIAKALERDPKSALAYVSRGVGNYYVPSALGGGIDLAIRDFQKAIELKPAQAAYYNSLGNVMARAGKIPEAQQAYQKSAELDPANAAMAYQNLGIVLFQAGRAKEAVDPLRKASELDPKKAQVWYLLGAALVGSMEFKKEGDTMVPVLQPGTVEAYQKCIELDPNGSYGTQAKAGLEQLTAMGLGISTKVKSAKKKG